MTQKDEALRMAIEVLTEVEITLIKIENLMLQNGADPKRLEIGKNFKTTDAIKICKAALITNAPTIEADSGEAVAWVGYKPQSDGTYFPFLFLEKPKPIGLINIEPLYTSPPKRQWVNLDPFEVDALISTPPKDDIELAQLVRKIQAKLKELNHG